MTYVFLNGKVVPSQKATLHVSDLAILRGYAIFDFLQTKQGIPLYIDDYLSRFYNSAAAMQLQIPYERSALKRKINALIRKNAFSHSGLKLVLTGGYSDDGFTPTTPNFFILETPIAPLSADYQGYTHGTKLILHHFLRELSEIKSINYITPVTLQEKWKNNDAIDVLYHQNGFITESSRSNFFIVTQNNVLVTPNNNVLHGITRKKVLALAKGLLKIEVRDMTLNEVLEAKEAFMCSSTKGVLPVVQLDEHIISSGKVGTYSQALIQRFNEMEAQYIAKMSKSKT